MNHNPILLWLDDYRDPNICDWSNFSPINRPFDIVWVKNYDEFVNYYSKNYNLVHGICFDHDLGDDSKDGYECAKWLVNFSMDNNIMLPKFNSQSANPTGRENILSLLENFLKHERT